MAKSLTKSPKVNSRAEHHQLPPLPLTFYLRDTVTVAKDLLGKGLLVGRGKDLVLVEIVETEAYLGLDDPASHAFRGITRRNWPMFELGGTCYVYLSYGINYCMNVATREQGLGQAVLLRAGVPILGLDVIKRRRPAVKKEKDLLNGPGKLTIGLGVEPTFNGRRFDEEDFKIVDLGARLTPSQILTTPRIGISKAVDKPWRFLKKA